MKPQEQVSLTIMAPSFRKPFWYGVVFLVAALLLFSFPLKTAHATTGWSFDDEWTFDNEWTFDGGYEPAATWSFDNEWEPGGSWEPERTWRSSATYESPQPYQNTASYSHDTEYEAGDMWAYDEEYEFASSYSYESDYQAAEPYEFNESYESASEYSFESDYQSPEAYQFEGGYEAGPGYTFDETYQFESDYQAPADYTSESNYQSPDDYTYESDYESPAPYTFDGEYQPAPEYTFDGGYEAGPGYTFDNEWTFDTPWEPGDGWTPPTGGDTNTPPDVPPATCQIPNPNIATNFPPPAGPVIALGDSLTAGVGATAGQDYVSELARLSGTPIINAGISGDTTVDVLARLDADVLSQNPSVVILLVGGNDILQRAYADAVEADSNVTFLDEIINAILRLFGKIPDNPDAITEDETFANIESMVTQIQATGALVILVGIEGKPFERDLSVRYEAIAANTTTFFVPDVLDSLIGRPQYMSDLVHPNNTGYEIVAQRIFAAYACVTELPGA